jgi:hypothetical protein
MSGARTRTAWRAACGQRLRSVNLVHLPLSEVSAAGAASAIRLDVRRVW